MCQIAFNFPTKTDSISSPGNFSTQQQNAIFDIFIYRKKKLIRMRDMRQYHMNECCRKKNIFLMEKILLFLIQFFFISYFPDYVWHDWNALKLENYKSKLRSEWIDIAMDIIYACEKKIHHHCRLMGTKLLPLTMFRCCCLRNFKIEHIDWWNWLSNE